MCIQCRKILPRNLEIVLCRRPRWQRNRSEQDRYCHLCGRDAATQIDDRYAISAIWADERRPDVTLVPMGPDRMQGQRQTAQILDCSPTTVKKVLEGRYD